MSGVSTRFDCKSQASNELRSIVELGGSVSLAHRPEDPPSVNRITASVDDLEVEILPSKGFSVGQVYLHGRSVLWDPPIGICDPDTLDLFSDEVAVNGAPAPGFTFLKTFSSGIELYGLRNWGMPRYDDQRDFLHPLHGETSNIPVDFCEVEINDKEIRLSASFIYRDMIGHSPEIWHQQGRELFAVERRVIIRRDKPRIQLVDSIKNISNEKLRPDWGYHITFAPQIGSRLLVPSKSVENRSGEKVPDDFNKWSPAKDSNEREETGIIHKGLASIDSEAGKLNYALVVHPDGTGIVVRFTPAPYFQTWLCRGGAYSQEFTNVSDSKPLFTKNWDGIGIEIGSGALDHNGNTDPSVPEQAPLAPGTSVINHLFFDLIDGEELQKMKGKILGKKFKI